MQIADDCLARVGRHLRRSRVGTVAGNFRQFYFTVLWRQVSLNDKGGHGGRGISLMPGTAGEHRVSQLADVELAGRRIKLEQMIATRAPGEPGTAVLAAKQPGIAGEQDAPVPGRRARRGTGSVNGDPVQQFLALLEKAPDVDALLDEHSGLWTVALPPPTDLDAGREVRGSLAEVTAAVTQFLGRRDRLLHTAMLAQLDVLRAYWGERFEIGWNGEWWCQNRDGTGEREYASSSEQLNRLMGNAVTRFQHPADATEKETHVRVYRGMRQAETAQLTGLRDTVTELLDTYERFLGPDMVEGLCLLREAAVREQRGRPAPDGTVPQLQSARAS
jgi:hypothetical protein